MYQRLTKPYHPWTNGQVERMHRTLKEQTVYRYFYQTHAQLCQHLEAFIQAYNFGKRLKTLKGRSPYEFICDRWRENPENFHNLRTISLRDYTAREGELNLADSVMISWQLQGLALLLSCFNIIPVFKTRKHDGVQTV